MPSVSLRWVGRVGMVWPPVAIAVATTPRHGGDSTLPNCQTRGQRHRRIPDGAATCQTHRTGHELVTGRPDDRAAAVVLFKPFVADEIAHHREIAIRIAGGHALAIGL